MKQTLAQAIIDNYLAHAEQIHGAPCTTQLADHAVQWRRLTADSSIKQFVAVHYQQQDYRLIILPNTGKGSEELFADEAAQPYSQAEAFIQCSRLLSEYCGNIPAIYAINEQQGILLTAVHGQQTLFDFITATSITDELVQTLLTQCIDWIIKLQTIACQQHPDFIACQRQLGKQSLLLECQEFLDYGLPYHRQKSLNANELEEYQQQSHYLSEQLGQQQKLLIHRDMQSKNILLDDKQIAVIDYQDCCLGPYCYDLASLLYDPYVAIEQTVIEYCQQYYYQQATAKKIITISVEQFKQDCQLAGIQRLLKAAGRYIYIAQVKQRDTHLQFFQPALQRCLALIRNFAALTPLAKLITQS